MTAPSSHAALKQLVETWRQEGARIDTFHATMGSGYKVCADELDAALAALPAQENVVRWHTDDLGDLVCPHGVATDVHCCNCHSGFIFDPDHVCEEENMDVPRRNRIDLFVPAEKAIFDAVQAVEAMPAE